jgi:hypothetical protein
MLEETGKGKIEFVKDERTTVSHKQIELLDAKVEYRPVDRQEKEAVLFLQSRDYIIHKKNAGPAVVR